MVGVEVTIVVVVEGMAILEGIVEYLLSIVLVVVAIVLLSMAILSMKFVSL